jgi:uncharacterized protein (TIGR02646 family)
MKHILKSAKNEPQSLRDYRRTPDATYSGYTDKDPSAPHHSLPPLKNMLAQEQGYICCYCMRRIGESAMSVEHYISQKHHPSSPLAPEEHKANDLNYNNLLASCNAPERNCSQIRGNQWLKIDPRKKECESLVVIDKNGRATSSDPEIQHALDEILQLNTDALIENRKAIIDLAMDRIQKKKEEGNYNRKLLENELAYWRERREGRFWEYCMAAVHYLQSKLKYAS